MLQHAQSSAVAIMERAVSFLKTEQARGVPGMSDRLGNLEASLKDAPVVNIVGRAIIDFTLASTRLTLARTPSEPCSSRTGLTTGLGKAALETTTAVVRNAKDGAGSGLTSMLDRAKLGTK